MRMMGWLRRWPIATMLATVIVAQSVVILLFAVSTSRIVDDVEAIRGEVTEVATSAEARAMESQERGERRLSVAMGCLTGLLLIPPDQRSDEAVHRVCPADLIDDVRASLR